MEEITTTYSIDPDTFALMEAPVWESHKRGKNWMAVISRDATKPSGLEREFIPVARGEGRYYLGGLDIAHRNPVPFPVEFGADYYSGSGKRHADRVYGVVRAIRKDGLDFTRTATAYQACRLAKELSTIEVPNVLGDISTDAIGDELCRRFRDEGPDRLEFSSEDLLAELRRRCLR